MKPILTGYWSLKKDKLKDIYPNICDEDLICNDGKEREMVEILGKKLGKSKEEMIAILVDL